MNVLNLVLGLLPVGEEIASLFIHNPASKHKFTAVISTVNNLAPVVAAIGAGALHNASPATPAVEPGFVADGVPSGHVS